MENHRDLSKYKKSIKYKIDNNYNKYVGISKDVYNSDEDALKPIKHYFFDSDEDFQSVLLEKSKKKKNEQNCNHTNLLDIKTNRKYKNVFDRLTDTNFYTGIHKERFDELGNGRGKAGTTDIYIHDGWTQAKTRNHEIYSSDIKKSKKNPVVTPGTLGIQKYGIQIASPKNIWIFRNGDKHHNGILFLVKPHINNLKTLFFEITKVLSPTIGPIRKIYDQNFRLVRSVEHLVEGAKYLCTSGDPPAPIDRLQLFLSKWVIQN
ncbi:apicortin, putative [Plasmodium gallinaceum]|uniref:Apicortin, putative n=1 Tax=Plasmodium gallinaceum TaxID=5849 RepID=A0A1J1GZD2_PLAGA|nr:apicortin, putative [Plasmodium gallinaceum]CRG97956.1 apicortin, putative [Plasmodium gallinaceum]